MKIVYLVHQIDSIGCIEDNIISLTQIIKKINLTMPDVVPFVPYFADITVMDIRNLQQMRRAALNDDTVMARMKFDEIWVVGENRHPEHTRLMLSLGMKFNVPIVDMTNKI